MSKVICGLLRLLIFFFTLISSYFSTSLLQHWLEFPKSIAKQMKCKYLKYGSG